MEITFIYIGNPKVDLKESNLAESYTVKKELANNDSITEAAKDIVKSYNKQKRDYLESQDKDRSVFLSFNPIEGQTLYTSYPDYYFNEKNEVIFLDLVGKANHNWTLKELKNMKLNGYVKNDISIVYISELNAIGAAFPVDHIIEELSKFIVSVLEPVFVELAIKGGRHIATKGKKRHIQRVANQWVKKQGLRGGRQLRLFIVNKGNWRLDELARCLSISQEDAMSLLISLGYELKDNQYIPCYSEEAVQNRRRWEKKENLQ